MKRLLILQLLIFSSANQVYGINLFNLFNQKVNTFTQQFNMSFSPTGLDAIKSTGISYLAYKLALTQKFNKPKQLAALLFLSSFLYNSLKNTDVLKRLLSNPLDLLSDIRQIQQNFYKEGQQQYKANGNVSRQELLELLIKYEGQCPIFLLGECYQENAGFCILSRNYDTNYRNQFENAVVESLLNKLHSNNQPVQYVSFASGDLFQDLVIIAKTLIRKPNAKIVIHVIDKKNTINATALDFIGKGREVKFNEYPDFSSVMKNLIELARSKSDLKHLNDEELGENLTSSILLNHIQLMQFIGFLQTSFSSANLELHVHEDCNSYFQYIEKYNLPSADIIATTDIEDEKSQISKSLSDYEQLCFKSLQKKPLSLNFWLGKKGKYKDTAEIRKLKINGQNEIEILTEDINKSIIPSFVRIKRKIIEKVLR